MEVRFQEHQRKTKICTELTTHRPPPKKKNNLLIFMSDFLFFAERMGWRAASYFFLRLLEHRAI
jgi:hypothetical protein